MSNLQQLDKTYVAGTYARFPVEIANGKGSVVYDFGGKRYIDMGSGIGVTGFGIADDEWANAVTAQLTSNDKSVFYGMYSDSTPTDDDGEYIYNFHFRLPDETDSRPATTGVYRLRIGNSVTVDDKTFNFVTPEDRVTLYNELKSLGSCTQPKVLKF